MQTPRHSPWTQPILITLFFAICSTLFYRFFDRPTVFWDQVINTGRVLYSPVCNYALRPLFYAWIKLVVFAGGIDLRSIPFAGVVVSIGITWMLTCHAFKQQGFYAGLTTLTVTVWMGWLYPLGATGMPHLYPALFGISAFLLLLRYLQSPRPITQVFATLLVWAALASHPTGLGYVAAFYATLGLNLVYFAYKNKSGIRSVIAGCLPSVITGLASLGSLEACYRLFSPKGYIAFWIQTLGKVQNTQISTSLHGSSHYYVQQLFERYFPLFSAAVIATLFAGILYFVRRRKKTIHSTPIKLSSPLINTLLFITILIGVYSISSWKLNQVLLGFSSLFGLLLVNYLFSILHFFGKWKTPLSLLLSILLSAIGFCQYSQDAQAVLASLSRIDKYAQPFLMFKTRPTGDMIYMETTHDTSHSKRTAKVFANSTNRQIHYSVGFPETEEQITTFVQELLTKDIRWIGFYLDSDASEHISHFRSRLMTIGCHRSFLRSYSLSHYEFWEFNPLKTGTEAEYWILAHRGKVGIVASTRNGKTLAQVLSQSGLSGVTRLSAMDFEALNRRLDLPTMSCVVFESAGRKYEPDLEATLKERGFEFVDQEQLLNGIPAEFSVWKKKPKPNTTQP